jgi:hypothetical protein
MLHFPLDKPKNVYIGVCNWGIPSHVGENKSLLYSYAIKAKMKSNIAEWKHMALELFYVFRP